MLIEKLLNPGGWLLMDELDWTYAGVDADQSDGVAISRMSDNERIEPHLRAVFELSLASPDSTPFHLRELSH